MKRSEKIIRIGLIFLILLSVYLSYEIWLSSDARSQLGDEESNVVATTTYRQPDEVFLPTRLIWVNSTEDVRMGTGETLISKVHEQILKGKITNLKDREYDNADEFAAVADISEGVELNYFGSFQLYEYAKIFQVNVEEGELKAFGEGKESFFTKIQIDFKNGLIRFVNPRRNQVIEGDFDLDLTKVKEALNDTKVSWIQMTGDKKIQGLQYNSDEPITLKQYSYIASTQAYTVFRNAFFQKPESVKSSEEAGDTILYGDSETLRVAEDQQIVEFQGKLASNEEMEDDIYDQSYHYVNRLESSIGSLRFFDRGKEDITYRTFIEGFPVFGDGYQGEVSFTLEDTGSTTPNVTIMSSLNTIQIPIPSDETVQLPATSTVIDELLASGADQSLFQGIVVGYQRQKVKNADEIVDMIPMWYLKYDGQWYSEAQLKAKLAGEGN
ncbi:two-component system activity regulator YycH [Enterococcus asini]|uniref:YycH family regulatory protein n=1 Tax=Enterococcus asini TaxID=57732 RepID=UPI00288D2914|nr:two-component system activity regulator YycH [Enterococcus asini]MDT2756036.1 two-component system activity regulator YycH [Enterococcus asini]